MLLNSNAHIESKTLSMFEAILIRSTLSEFPAVHARLQNTLNLEELIELSYY